MNPKVDTYLLKSAKWQNELTELRKIILDCGLTEELKWGAPCYTFQNKNIIIIGELKDCCVLSFFKGSLLNDPENILDKPGPNTQSARIIRFKNMSEIRKLKTVIKAYISEAIENEKDGEPFPFSKKPSAMPEELILMMNEDADFKKAFEMLTPGKQRGYILYFSAAKQSATRVSRIEKLIPRILKGKGLQD